LKNHRLRRRLRERRWCPNSFAIASADEPFLSLFPTPRPPSMCGRPAIAEPPLPPRRAPLQPRHGRAPLCARPAQLRRAARPSACRRSRSVRPHVPDAACGGSPGSGPGMAPGAWRGQRGSRSPWRSHSRPCASRSTSSWLCCRAHGRSLPCVRLPARCIHQPAERKLGLHLVPI
jgi:hypothetical protein